VQNTLSSIADDVVSTNRLINAQVGPVLLVGHSYGGAVITEAGNNPKVPGMVYVAAFAPEEGETLGGMAAKYPTPPAYSEFRQVDDGYLVPTEKGVWESFAQDLSPAEQSLVFAVQGATEGTILGTPIKKAARHSKPSWFVIASNEARSRPSAGFMRRQAIIDCKGAIARRNRHRRDQAFLTLPLSVSAGGPPFE
jgi:pimeloyl-ACP methyl ester carboxylesterase